MKFLWTSSRVNEFNFPFISLADFITPKQLSVVAILLSIFFFVICCLIPESPHFVAYSDMKYKDTFECEKTVKLHSLWSMEDLQRKSIVDLFTELKKLNLLSLIGLLLVEQFIGGISILFYMKHFAQLSGKYLYEIYNKSPDYPIGGVDHVIRLHFFPLISKSVSKPILKCSS